VARWWWERGGGGENSSRNGQRWSASTTSQPTNITTRDITSKAIFITQFYFSCWRSASSRSLLVQMYPTSSPLWPAAICDDVIAIPEWNPGIRFLLVQMYPTRTVGSQKYANGWWTYISGCTNGGWAYFQEPSLLKIGPPHSTVGPPYLKICNVITNSIAAKQYSRNSNFCK